MFWGVLGCLSCVVEGFLGVFDHILGFPGFSGDFGYLLVSGAFGLGLWYWFS